MARPAQRTAAQFTPARDRLMPEFGLREEIVLLRRTHAIGGGERDHLGGVDAADVLRIDLDGTPLGWQE
ncbi:hypothetical protein [Tomitella cavernea]|uniref:Uncharacterized protein n=1 Tax=Tomitella cavernea TaxID=1387982 RepID=A0ABP9D1Q7_9ACTN|nr:hypothetical protein [Tomitella cavernea]